MLSQEQQRAVALARAAVAIEHTYRQALKDSIANFDATPEEEVIVTSGVIGLLVKGMYRQRGSPWLEALLKMVLEPDGRVATEDASARQS